VTLSIEVDGRQCPLVLVEWFDAKGPTADWTEIKELVAQSPVLIRSVGYKIADTDHRIIILPHASADGDGFGEIVIPRGMLAKITELTSIHD
jgi:hypothetical protein